MLTVNCLFKQQDVNANALYKCTCAAAITPVVAMDIDFSGDDNINTITSLVRVPKSRKDISDTKW